MSVICEPRMKIKTRYQLLALDLDGTVVRPDLTVSETVRERLRFIQTQTDCRVVVATGRMALSARHFAESLGITTPVISYQGAMICDAAGQRLFHQPIAEPVAAEVIALAQAHHINTLHMYVNNRLFVTPNNPYIEHYARIVNIKPVIVDNLRDHVTEAPTKFLLIDEDHMVNTITLLEKAFDGRLAVCQSRQDFCEIIDQRVSKWAGLLWLAEQWGITPDSIMAVGDHDNDVPMLKSAGLGVAMGNAAPSAQQVAGAITATVEEDGVAQAIDRFLLGTS